MAQAYTPYPENSLVMLGVIHRDTTGATLLSDVLDRLQPDVVTLEFSQYGLDYRRSNGEALRRKVRNVVDELVSEGHCVDTKALGTVISYIDPPPEFNVTSDFVRRHKGRFFLVDPDLFSYERLKDMEELVAKENLLHLLSNSDHIRDERYEKTLARLFFEKGVKLFPYTEEMHVRDRYMRDKIRHLMKRYTTSRFLHICGWQHLADPCNLYQQLNPTKVFIYDKTLCI